MAKVTAPQSPKSPKHPGGEGNNMHMPPAEVKAPLGEKGFGTPEGHGYTSGAWGPVTPYAHRPEAAVSTLLPASIDHTGKEEA